MNPSPRVDHHELELDDRRRFRFGGVPFTGIAVDRAADGSVSELPYVDGRLEGVAEVRDRAGAVRETIGFRWGARHGPTTRRDGRGRPLAEELYEYGILTRRRRYDSDGLVASEWLIGPDDDTFELLRLSRLRFGR